MENKTKGQSTSILPLVEQWELFASSYKQKDIRSFAEWVLHKEKEKPLKDSNVNDGRGKMILPANKEKLNNNARAAIFVTRLQRYVSLYTKPHVKKLGFTRQHEYTFLHQISKMENTNKKELSKEILTELSTGRDIVRRLIARGLVSEKVNPADRRATQLNITEKGKKLLSKSHELIGHSFDNFLGDLSMKEQQQFIKLLQKLNDFHAKETKVELLAHL